MFSLSIDWTLLDGAWSVIDTLDPKQEQVVFDHNCWTAFYVLLCFFLVGPEALPFTYVDGDQPINLLHVLISGLDVLHNGCYQQKRCKNCKETKALVVKLPENLG